MSIALASAELDAARRDMADPRRAAWHIWGIEDALRDAEREGAGSSAIDAVRFAGLELALGAWLPRLVAAAPSFTDADRREWYLAALNTIDGCVARYDTPAGRSHWPSYDAIVELADTREGLKLAVGAALA